MLYLPIIALVGAAFAQDHGSTYGGTGPYKSYYFEVESLVNHTFYQPLQSGFESSSSPSLKLPVVVWVGLKFRGFLGEVASWGVLAIATGPAFVDPEGYVDPNENATSSGDTLVGENPAALTAAIDWVYANAGKGDWQHIDSTRIGVWGQSCGGLEAYAAGAQDDRVSHLGIFNSGQLSANASEEVASNITKPVFYVLGGPTDVAYENASGERDYADLPAETPKWKGNHALGHSAAFDYPNAGIAGVAGSHLAQWVLRGNETAKEWFTGPGANETGFQDVVYENLDAIKVTPI
ncbi:hypothetical protein PFICI_04953 [Pestalotiopsis fici W106-1]|uniref:Dienelactone hydrolase domain-containing protein n=1 Tax=Pestalotiopsis fici (strain W106-1 / CGMCC3.15140) TaxID=1229662 RepID=W3XCA5_PESFW|nr:uncharacterized protein PFICI_04953 [Pestalotiopsis fici W106-1]ETS83077.1 hypothetical protein PFICI_04953 [Pestalotiopsis fici W106-1]